MGWSGPDRTAGGTDERDTTSECSTGYRSALHRDSIMVAPVGTAHASRGVLSALATTQALLRRSEYECSSQRSVHSAAS